MVKHRACLSVGRLIVGVQARLFGRQIAGVSARSFGRLDCRRSTVVVGTISIVIAGIAALSVCRWYVAVRCQRRVGSVGRSARSLVIGWVRNSRRIGAIVVQFVVRCRGHIGMVSCRFRFVYILARGLLGRRVYQLQQLSGLAAIDTSSFFFYGLLA